MSLPASIEFFLLGICFLVLPQKKYHPFLLTVITLVMLSSLITLLNYACGTVYFRQVLQLLSTSPLAAICFIIIGAALLHHPRMEHIRFSFQAKIGIFFLIATLVLGFLFFALRNNNSTAEAIGLKTNEADTIISMAESLHTSVEMMHNKFTSELVSGNTENMNEHENAIREILDQADRLKKLAGGSQPELKEAFDSLKEKLYSYANTFRKLTTSSAKLKVEPGVMESNIRDNKNQMADLRLILIRIKRSHRKWEEKLQEEENMYHHKSTRIIQLSQWFAIFFLLLAFFMIYQNTAKKEIALTALDEKEKFLKAIISNSSNPIAIRDLNGQYLLVNDRVEEITGLPREKVVGKSLWEIHEKELADSSKAMDDEVVRSKKVMIREQTILHGDTKRSFVVSRFPILDESDNIYAVGSIGTEISALRETQELLEEYMHFFNNSNDLCAICTIDSEFKQLNAMVLSTLGYAEAEMIGKSFIDFVHPDDILFIVKEIEQSRKTETSTINFSRRFLKKNGDYIWINWKAIMHPDTGHIYAIGRDITEQKNLEVKLKQFNIELEKQVEEKSKQIAEKEQQYRFLLENMQEGIQLIDFNWRYLFVNNSVVGQSRYATEKELLGKTVQEIYPGVESTELFSVLNRCMKERESVSLESPFIFPNGEMAWFELSVQPVPEGIFILSSDISARKKVEDKLSNYTEELKRSNAELERFAYVASHDLQEPLRMVSSFINLLSRRMNDKLDDTSKQYMHYATDGAERMKTLIHDLLEYSRVGTQKETFKAVNPAEVLTYVVRVLDEDIRKNKAEIDIHPMPVIIAGKTLFSQLFMNLLSNALKYHGDKIPHIEIGCTEGENEYTFYVADNGEGIEQRFFDKIFIIFQRLHNKSEYSGTGIGLAICKKIVETHKGRIWVESEKGKGSTFYFTIPKINV